MSGGGGGGGNDGVEYQREQEDARQARIRQGMTNIDNIFNGYTKPATRTVDPTSKVAFDARWGTQPGTYYDAQGNPLTFTNTNQILKKKGIQVNSPERGLIYTPTDLYSKVIETPEEQVAGFDDNYYNKRATAYQDFALPQLQDQYKDQQKALTYALSRGGNLGSSLAAQKTAALDKDYALQQQSVYDTGQDYANKARSDVASQKQNLVSLLQASADPDATANLAQSSAASLSAMPAFSPLSPVISNVASGLGTYLANQQTADAIKKAYAGGGSYTNSLSTSSGKVG